MTLVIGSLGSAMTLDLTVKAGSNISETINHWFMQKSTLKENIYEIVIKEKYIGLNTEYVL